MKDILVRARALIAGPGQWMQGDYSDGALVSEFCTCFCAAGAILHAAGVVGTRGLEDKHPITDVLEAFAVAAGLDVNADFEPGFRAYRIVEIIALWNDEGMRTQDDVVAAFDRAIEAAQ